MSRESIDQLVKNWHKAIGRAGNWIEE
jgi:hypothetical protein